MKKIAVIVGRYQVHRLQKEQISLIEKLLLSNDIVTIVLGLSSQRATANNPLDFNSRKDMIREEFPKILVRYIEDQNNDTVWSDKLDQMVENWFGDQNDVTIYGSTDGFINHYNGRNKYCNLDSDAYISQAEILRQIKERRYSSESYRAGMFVAAHHRWPTSFQTVDVAILNDDYTKLLLARKPHQDKWRFVGGFADPTSESLEADAIREVKEEANIAVDEPKYICSTLINDSRYRGERDKIKTALFVTQYTGGRPEGGDDVAEVKWFEFNEALPNEVVSSHHILLDKLTKWKEQN